MSPDPPRPTPCLRPRRAPPAALASLHRLCSLSVVRPDLFASFSCGARTGRVVQRCRRRTRRGSRAFSSNHSTNPLRCARSQTRFLTFSLLPMPYHLLTFKRSCPPDRSNEGAPMLRLCTNLKSKLTVPMVCDTASNDAHQPHLACTKSAQMPRFCPLLIPRVRAPGALSASQAHRCAAREPPTNPARRPTSPASLMPLLAPSPSSPSPS